MARKQVPRKRLSWQDLSQLLRQVLDFYGVDYQVIPLRCGDDPHCADSFHFDVLGAELHLKCAYGTFPPSHVRIIVGTNDYGVPIFSEVQIGDLSLKVAFSTLLLDREGIGLQGLDGLVRFVLCKGAEEHADSDDS